MKWWTEYIRGARDGVLIWGILALTLALATTGRF
jgi:hypothetical protein